MRSWVRTVLATAGIGILTLALAFAVPIARGQTLPRGTMLGLAVGFLVGFSFLGASLMGKPEYES